MHGDNLPNPIFLVAPDGITWKIVWIKHDDGGILLQHGWKELVEYYSLNHGHMIMFKYKGICYMDIYIYDTTGLEIVYPFHSQGPQTPQTHLDEDLGEISNLSGSLN